jgi:protease IV
MCSLGVAEADATSLLASSPNSAAELVSHGVLTDTAYRDETLRHALKTSEGGDTKRPTLLSLGSYAAVRPSDLGLQPPARGVWGKVLRRPAPPAVAVVPIEGAIRDGRGVRQGTVYAQPTAEVLAGLAEREDVKAVVLRVDSPGGSALASDTIWRAASLLGQRKPVIASMGDAAASGGYYIAMAAQEVSTVCFYMLCDLLSLCGETSLLSVNADMH